MAHPLMFDDADPVLARVRELALALPGAAEKISHGRPVFHTAKVFAWYGGSVKVDGVRRRHDQAILVLLDPAEAQALLREERCFVPAYTGPSGWIGVDLDEGSDWVEAGELLEMSFRNTARKGLIAALEERD